MRCIEVCDPATGSYFEAKLERFSDTTIDISYPHSEKRNETVPLSSARLPPPFSLDSFPQNFNINDITGQSQSMRNVEVLTKASYLDKSPPSWWLGTIVDQKQDLFLVQVNGKIKFENWFGVGLIRPPNPSQHLAPGVLKIAAFDVPADLVTKFQDDKTHTVFCKNTGLVSARLEPHQQGKLIWKLVVIGEAEAVHRATLLKDLHFKQARQYVEVVPNFVKISFPIRANMTGYVIGRGGANIKNASSIQGIKTVKVNSDTNMVTIIAENAAAAEKAKKLLDIDSLKIPVETNRFFDLIEQNTDSIVSNAKLSHLGLRYDNVMLIGSPESIQDAQVMIEFLKSSEATFAKSHKKSFGGNKYGKNQQKSGNGNDNYHNGNGNNNNNNYHNNNTTTSHTSTNNADNKDATNNKGKAPIKEQNASTTTSAPVVAPVPMSTSTSTSTSTSAAPSTSSASSDSSLPQHDERRRKKRPQQQGNSAAAPSTTVAAAPTVATTSGKTENGLVAHESQSQKNKNSNNKPNNGQQQQQQQKTSSAQKEAPKTATTTTTTSVPAPAPTATAATTVAAEASTSSTPVKGLSQRPPKNKTSKTSAETPETSKVESPVADKASASNTSSSATPSPAKPSTQANSTPKTTPKKSDTKAQKPTTEATSSETAAPATTTKTD